jgi:DNA-binding PadR family transcriptional regulator
VAPRRTRETEQAVAEAAPLETARAAAGGGGRGGSEPLLADLRRGGLLPLLVLHFLQAGPSYGNQLMERITAVTGGLVGVNPNTMYPLLRDLEARALVAGEWEHPERRSRRFYRLTEAGDTERARLAEQLAPHLDAIAATVDALRAEVLPDGRA